MTQAEAVEKAKEQFGLPGYAYESPYPEVADSVYRCWVGTLGGVCGFTKYGSGKTLEDAFKDFEKRHKKKAVKH